MGYKDLFTTGQDLAQIGLNRQVVREGDYHNSEGLLMCGTCGKPRQMRIMFPAPTDDDLDREEPLLIVVSCDCDKIAEEKEAAREQAEEDMKVIDKLKRASLIDDKFKDSTFSLFHTNKYNEQNFRLCQTYTRKFEMMLEKNQGLLLWGDFGTGKSFAAACIANQLLEQKIPVVMTSFVKLLTAFQKGAESEEKILSRINKAKLVIFDDLGAERSTDYALEKVYNIIDSRYRSGKPMILTTNLTITQMKQESDIRYGRIYDRIFEICYPMQWTGPSWRKATASKRFNDMRQLLEDM